MKRRFCLYFLIGLAYVTHAQERLGLVLDSYAGINGIALNPSSGVVNPLGWDINIATGAAFVSNDLFFIRDAGVRRIRRNIGDLASDPQLDWGVNKGGTLLFDAYDRPRPTYFSVDALALLPSVQINLKNGSSFGFFTGLRSHVSSLDMPEIGAPYAQKRLDYNVPYTVPPFNISGAIWREIGFNYAYFIGEPEEGGLGFGISVKRLTGHEGFFVQNAKGTGFTRLAEDSFRIDGIYGRAAFTNDNLENGLQKNGEGWSIDLGATYIVPTTDDRPYLWRLGASLLDMGRIDFKKNAEYHEAAMNQPYTFSRSQYLNLDPNDPQGDAVNRFNVLAFGRPNATIKDSSFMLSLPAAFSVQADYAFTPFVYLNATLVQRLAFGFNNLYRDNLLALTPRFESRWLSAALPITLTNYKQLRVGAAARLGFVTIGTERLGSFFKQKEWTGTDFYIALKLNSFKINRLGNEKGYVRGRATPCYRF